MFLTKLCYLDETPSCFNHNTKGFESWFRFHHQGKTKISMSFILGIFVYLNLLS